MKELKMIMKIVLSILFTLSLIMAIVFIGRGYFLEVVYSLVVGIIIFEISQRI